MKTNRPTTVLFGLGLLLSIGCAPAAGLPTPLAAQPAVASVSAISTPATRLAQATPAMPPTPTPIDSAGGSPRLSAGTLAEAERALGFKLAAPTYLPAGATLEDGLVRYATNADGRFATLGYRVGQRVLSVQYLSGSARNEEQGTSTQVGRCEAIIRTESKEPSDRLQSGTTVAWQAGELMVRVQGNLPREEVLRVAASLCQ